MKKILLSISCLLIVMTLFSQKKLISLNADKFIAVDNLNNIYFIKDNVLIKKTKSETLNYKQLFLGNISSVDITNPYKIIVFYKNFNTFVMLDDALNELADPINLNAVLINNISYMGTASGSNIWLFNKNNNELNLYHYPTKEIIKTKKLNVDINFKTATSNYHNFWLFSDDLSLNLNNFLALKTQSFQNFEKVIAYKKGIVFLNKNQFYYYNFDKSPKLLATIKNINIKDFYVNNHLIYFFDGNTIYTQEIPKN